MLDLSEESKDENIATCVHYFKRMAWVYPFNFAYTLHFVYSPMKLFLEMEIGITGGEEDGVNNEGVDNASLYTQPEDIWDIYREFSKVTPLESPWVTIGFRYVHHCCRFR